MPAQPQVHLQRAQQQLAQQQLAQQQQQQLAALSRDVSDSVEARFRGDRQAVFAMARQLVQAQFVEGNGELARRLWDDVAERGLDVDRVIHLMYRCIFIDDDAAMLEADEAYAASR